jgi:Transcription factor regulating root and shoot growth via Pin3
VGSTKNSNKLPPVPPVPMSSIEALTAAIEGNAVASLVSTELSSNSNCSSGPHIQNGPSSVSHRSSKSSYVEATPKNGSKISDQGSNQESEWVEQDEPGVYITLTSLSGGARDLKRVRFR